jgi:hypothetical protein
MKFRYVVYISVLGLALLAAALWLWPVQQRPAKQSHAEPPATADTSNEAPAAPLPLGITHSPSTSDSASTRVAQPTMPTHAEDERKWLDVGRRIADASNVPIDFYGRVIDPDSNGLSVVNIKISVEKLKAVISKEGFVGSKYSALEATSDSDGRFEIHGQTGDQLDIGSITKDGYDAEPGPRVFGGGTSSSYENPVIFKMWNTNAHQRLVSDSKAFRIVPDGRPYVIDLTKGAIAESGPGDLRVWIKYPLSVVRGETNDWSCEIDVITGGLQEEHDQNCAMYLAPPDGYTPSFQLQQRIKGGQKGSSGPRRFYVCLNGAQVYGRLDIELRAPFNADYPGLVRLSYTINPSGSRVLY